MPGEEPLEAARREFKEETGHATEGNFIPLAPIRQKGGKQVFCWAIEGEIDADKVVSNTFEIQGPPRAGLMQSFPEIDQAGWFNYNEAKEKINERQISFLDEFGAL